MPKIDPNLLASLEQMDSGRFEADREIQVIVGLRAAADASIEAELADRGLQVRSRAGDVVTGSVRLGDIRHLAEALCIVKIEASAPLYPEAFSGEG